jgi:hypothetical protein
MYSRERIRDAMENEGRGNQARVTRREREGDAAEKVVAAGLGISNATPRTVGSIEGGERKREET